MVGNELPEVNFVNVQKLLLLPDYVLRSVALGHI